MNYRTMHRGRRRNPKVLDLAVGPDKFLDDLMENMKEDLPHLAPIVDDIDPLIRPELREAVERRALDYFRNEFMADAKVVMANVARQLYGETARQTNPARRNNHAINYQAQRTSSRSKIAMANELITSIRARDIYGASERLEQLESMVAASGHGAREQNAMCHIKSIATDLLRASTPGAPMSHLQSAAKTAQDLKLHL